MNRLPTTAVATAALLGGLACAGTSPPPANPSGASTTGAAPREESTMPDADRPAAESAAETVTLRSPGSPLVAIRLQFAAGSIHDPAGREGLAALTARMVGDAATARRPYAELLELLYPMAASIEVTTDRELTVISGLTHRDNLEAYADLLAEAVLEPAFAESDLERHRGQLESYLTSTLRAGSDELLGLEALQQVLFAGHPYGHAPEGTVQGLAAITLEDVKAFYRSRFTRADLTIGLAGGYPDGFDERLTERLTALPAGTPAMTELPPPPPLAGRPFDLIAKETDSVGIHFGYPLAITRADADYYPLMVANSYLGEHRTFHGRLMQQLRGKRGLNYGDYSYIEHWDQPPFTSNPSPGFVRRQQYFSVWIRPVRPETAQFALRNALSEVDRLVERGLTQAEFELARDFLVNYSKLWAQTLPDRLGFLMDSRYLGMGYYIDEIDRRLGELTVDQVNAAVRKYITTDSYAAVLVTDDAAALEATLEADTPSPMEYNSAPDPDVLEADKAIEKRPIEPTRFRIVPVAEMFEK